MVPGEGIDKLIQHRIFRGTGKALTSQCAGNFMETGSKVCAQQGGEECIETLALGLAGRHSTKFRGLAINHYHPEVAVHHHDTALETGRNQGATQLCPGSTNSLYVETIIHSFLP